MTGDGELEDVLAGPAPGWRTGLALGFLAMLPLLVAYELSDTGNRSTAEMILSLALRPLGELEVVGRRLLLAGAGLVSLVVAARGGRALGPALGRIALEGAALALVLGPALVGLMHLCDVAPPRLTDPEAVPAGERSAFVFGAAAWEELLFRVGGYSALYLLVRRPLLVAGCADRLATAAGELAGIAGSTLLFAGAHLAAFTAWLGPGGEPYDPSVFTWRLLAGILLALVFRWRGPGVAAWTHGLFNLALLLGAGPDVFLLT